jgi:hypothetical protein
MRGKSGFSLVERTCLEVRYSQDIWSWDWLMLTVTDISECIGQDGCRPARPREDPFPSV